MPYEPITDKDGVRAAFETFREIFQEGAEEKKLSGYTRYMHRNPVLWGGFAEHTNKYLMMFGRRKSNDIFNANPKNTGDGGHGLFVRDKNERRFLTHDGFFDNDRPLKLKSLVSQQLFE